MNYKKLYLKLLEVHGTTTRPKNRYTERHHIIPKSLGGGDDVTNLVYVPARVHFICHRVLCKIYPESDKLKFAFWAMCNQLNGDVIRDYKVTSKVFEEARKNFSEANSRRHKGKKMPKEWCETLRRRMKGNTINKKGDENPLYGIPRSDEVKAKISAKIMENPEKNSNFKGYYVTPQGKFPSAPIAAANTDYSVDAIRKYCKNPDIVVCNRMVSSTSYFHQSQVGQPLRDLGWNFEPKAL